MKLITSAIALFLLFATGAFTFIWYQTNQTVKQAISALSPYAQISYGTITSSVIPGILGITDADIIIEGKRFRADSITFSAASILELYALQKNPYAYVKSQPRLDIRGLKSPHQARDLNLLAEVLDHRILRLTGNLAALGCGKRQKLNTADMAAMGYRGLQGDISLWSEPQPIGNGYRVELSSQLPRHGDYRVSVDFADAPADFAEALQRLTELDVISISLRSKDRGYNGQLQQFCAAEMATDVDGYLAIHMAAVEQFFLRSGIALESSDLGVYRESLHRGASKTLRLKPRRGFAIEDLHFYQPADYRDLLGIHFSANNRTVARTEHLTQQVADPVAKKSVESVRHEADGKQQQRAILGWDDLEKALQHQVIVYTASGGEHRGRVEQVDPQRLMLKQAFGANSMSFTIDRRRFSHATLTK